MEISVLERLVPLLASHRVSSFKERDLEIRFSTQDPVPTQANNIIASPAAASSTIPIQPNPEDFKANEVMEFDKVLNWSAPMTQDEIQAPLTGTDPLLEANQT